MSRDMPLKHCQLANGVIGFERPVWGYDGTQTFGPGTFGPGKFGPGTFGPGTFGPGTVWHHVVRLPFGPGTFGPGILVYCLWCYMFQ